jgi:hypothetical protein
MIVSTLPFQIIRRFEVQTTYNLEENDISKFHQLLKEQREDKNGKGYIWD